MTVAYDSQEVRTIVKIAVVAVIVAICSYYLNKWIGNALGAK